MIEVSQKELERRRKISQTLTGFKRPKRSVEHTQKLREANIGRKLSPLNRALLLSYAIGNKFNVGRKHSEEWKEKRRGKIPWNKGKPFEAMRGAKNPRWKGGITPINQAIRHSLDYKNWRRAVFEKDNYTCVICGVKNGGGKSIVLQADHIKPFALYPNLRLSLENGRTLCIKCHQKTPTYKRFSKQEWQLSNA